MNWPLISCSCSSQTYKHYLNKLGAKENEWNFTSLGAKKLPTDITGTAAESGGGAWVTERASNISNAAFAST